MIAPSNQQSHINNRTSHGPDNPHPLSQMKTELVWEGKYDEFGNRREVDIASCAMPMQRIETVDEPRQRAAAEGQTDMFEQKLMKVREDSPSWPDLRNRLIWGDNKLVMASLLQEFKGKIDLIYIDPPFDVGAACSARSWPNSGRCRDTREPSMYHAWSMRSVISDRSFRSSSWTRRRTTRRRPCFEAAAIEMIAAAWDGGCRAQSTCPY